MNWEFSIGLVTRKSFDFLLIDFAADTEISDWSQFQPLDINFLAAKFAYPKDLFLDFFQCFFDLENQFALSIQHANPKVPIQIE